MRNRWIAGWNRDGTRGRNHVAISAGSLRTRTVEENES
jgi:hypothetical protein